MELERLSLLLTIQLAVCFSALVDPNFEKQQMAARLQMACPAQPSAEVAKIFYNCLKDKGLPYDVVKVMCKCSKEIGFDACTIPGAWKATCDPRSKLNSPTDSDEVKDCILKSMQEQSTVKDPATMCQKAMEACKGCANDNKVKAAKGHANNLGGNGEGPAKSGGNNNKNNNNGGNNKKGKPSEGEMGAMAAIAGKRG